jgi:GxxExxY protein
VIGAAMAVHRTLGPGFLESVYQKAMAVELTSLGISFREQAPLLVTYRGQIVGEFIADFFIGDILILELKSVSALAAPHEVQLVNYLKATGVENGLLINFGAKSLEFQRKFKNPKNPVNLVNPVKISSGFSLIELMVAMVVMSLLLVLLLNMVDSGTRLWRVNENRVDSYREARAALGIISRDLQNALSATNNSNQFLLNATAFANLTSVGTLVYNTNQGAALFFLSALPSKSQDTASNKSDVCQVGYFMAFGKSSSASNSPINTMNIYRYILSSDPTFARLTASPPLFPSNTLTTLDKNVELLARNITRFTARAYTLTNTPAPNSLIPFSASTNTPVPDLVEISISAVNQEASKKLGTSDFAAWTSTNTSIYSNIVTPVEQTFTTRIKLNRPQ